MDLPSSGTRDDREDDGLRWLRIRLFSSSDLLIHEEYVCGLVVGEPSDLTHFDVSLQFTSLAIPGSVDLVLQGSLLAEERHDFEALCAAYELDSVIGGKDEHLVQIAYPFDLSWLALHPVGCLQREVGLSDSWMCPFAECVHLDQPLPSVDERDQGQAGMC